MKTFFFAFVWAPAIACAFFWSCDTPALEGPDCDQLYEPPVRIPDTQCDNPCKYGYAGTVDMGKGLLEAGCRRIEAGLRFYLDSVLYRKGHGAAHLQVLVIEAAADPAALRQGFFCRHDLKVEEQSGRVSFGHVLFTADPQSGMARILLAPEDSENGLLEEAVFNWRLSTRRPLPVR